MSNQGYYGHQQPQYGQPYGGQYNYPQQPPQAYQYQQPYPPQGYQPAPGPNYAYQPQHHHQQVQSQPKSRGCFEACIATLCCCFVCEEGCECCADCFECAEGCC